jgi:serralysin
MAIYRVADAALSISPTAYADLRSGVDVTVVNLVPEAVKNQIKAKAESGDLQQVLIGDTLIVTISADYAGLRYQSIYTYDGLYSSEPRYVSGVGKIGNQVITELNSVNVSITDLLSSGDGIDIKLSGNDSIYGTRNGDYLWGYAGNDSLFGGSGNDFLNGMSGIDAIDGGGGIDTLIVDNDSQGRYQKSSNSYWTIDGDVVVNVERVKFWDKAVALDINGTGGQAYRIYKAAFDRVPDTKGLGYWIDQIDNGMDVVEVAARFIDSPEFRAFYGQNPSHTEFLTKVYRNVLDRAPDSAGLAWWNNEMKTNPEKSWQKVLADFSESAENQANVASLIANGITYDPWS